MIDTLSKEILFLIHDDQFILWCLKPTVELDTKWNKWKIDFPEQKIAMEQARSIVLSVRLNGYSMPRIRFEALYARIQESLAKKQKKARHIQMYRYASACALVIICLIGAWILSPKERSIDLPVLFAESAIDSTQMEVELILDNQQKMLLENRTNIHFDAKGSIFVDKKQKSIQIIHSKKDKSIKTSSGLKALNVLKVPLGCRSSLILSDGTKIWANSGTVVHFPSVFEPDNRTIYVNGEIYLEVTKDASRPFYVRTSRMDLRVLGTSFDVSAYQNDFKQSVVLCKGCVEVDNRAGIKNKIHPNEMLSLEGCTMSISKVNTYNYTFWVDETFVFENRNLSEVMLQLSRYYNMEIDCSAEVKNLICSGKLILFQDIQSVMNTLSESLPISYKIKNNTIKINNKNKSL